jgi:hypothetical protein
MNQVYTIVLMLALVGLLTAQTAHGEDVIRLQNGTMVPNTLGVGAPNSEGITLLPNGTYGAYVNGEVGSQIGPVLVRDYHNDTITANSNMSAGARDNESDSNSMGNMTDRLGGYNKRDLRGGIRSIHHEVEYTLPELLAKVRQTANYIGIEISAGFHWAKTPQSLSAELMQLANLIEESYGYKIERYLDTVGRNGRKKNTSVIRITNLNIQSEQNKSEKEVS